MSSPNRIYSGTAALAAAGVTKAEWVTWYMRGQIKVGSEIVHGRPTAYSFGELVALALMRHLSKDVGIRASLSATVLATWAPRLATMEPDALNEDLFLMIATRRHPDVAVSSHDIPLVSASELGRRLLPDATGTVLSATLVNLSEIARGVRANLETRNAE